MLLFCKNRSLYRILSLRIIFISLLGRISATKHRLTCCHSPLTLTPLSGFSRKQQTAEFRVKLTSRPKINSKFESITEKAVGNHFSESAWPGIRLKTAILIYSNLVIRYYLTLTLIKSSPSSLRIDSVNYRSFEFYTHLSTVGIYKR